MSTYMPKAGEISRKWYVIDAAGKTLGRVAAEVAVLLRGKHKPEFVPHVDCGDNVIVINAESVVLTGSKLDNKYYLDSLLSKAEAMSGKKLKFVKLEAMPVTGCINWMLEN